MYDQIRATAPDDVVYMVTYTFSHPNDWMSQLQLTLKITHMFPKIAAYQPRSYQTFIVRLQMY